MSNSGLGGAGRPGRNRVTLKQVAQKAGVHPSTVSRALHPSTRSVVADDVVARILQVAKELGYRPNLMAAGLRTGRSHLIGALVPDTANTIFSVILSGATERLAEDGYSLVIADVGNRPERQLELTQQFIARGIDGLILATVRRDDPLVDFCVDQNLPTVLVNRAEEKRRISAVVSDDILGMQLAFDHLVQLGHNNIAHVAGPEATSTGHLRRLGFLQASRSHQQEGGAPPVVEAAAYSREAGALATAELLQKEPEVTAIVAANDLLALGAYDCLKALGIRCPEDISIVGHNDMPLVDMVSPPLTTIRISHQEIGRQAADLLLSRMHGTERVERNVVLAPQLIIRGSTTDAREAPLGKTSKNVKAKTA